jgi:hypothetical protein
MNYLILFLRALFHLQIVDIWDSLLMLKLCKIGWMDVLGNLTTFILKMFYHVLLTINNFCMMFSYLCKSILKHRRSMVCLYLNFKIVRKWNMKWDNFFGETQHTFNGIIQSSLIQKNLYFKLILAYFISVATHEAIFDIFLKFVTITLSIPPYFISIFCSNARAFS